MATVTTTYPGNTALQTDIWTLTVPEANAVIPYLNCQTGSYWYVTLDRPTRRAIRAKTATVRVYTVGFSSGELINALYATGATVVNT